MAESFKREPKKVDEVNEYTKKLDVFKKMDSENENHQELVPTEIDSDKPEDDNRLKK